MKIIFKKNKTYQNYIHCIRDDGTATWMKADIFFIMHDLMHYAVETTMNYKNGFYGMLETGIDITGFEVPKTERKFKMTAEALHAESLVNLLVIEIKQGKMKDINSMLAEIYVNNNYPFAPVNLSEEQHDKIMEVFNDLFHKWNVLDENNILELIFNS